MNSRLWSRLGLTQIAAALCFSLTVGLCVSAHAADDATSPRFLVHLLDYLAKDYAGAVSPDGKVLSPFEYAEQVEFAASAVKTNQILEETKSFPDIQVQLQELEAAIKGKKGPDTVTPLARDIQRRIIEVTKLVMSPEHWPDLEVGQRIFAQSCVSCHGEKGAGDGPAGKGLEPAPTNFTDVELMKDLAPFNAFNTIRLGVPGTGMAPQPHLSDNEVWALAFYVISLRHQGKAGAPPPDMAPAEPETLKRVATLSDRSLSELLAGVKDKDAAIVALRTHKSQQSQSGFLATAKAKLQESKNDFNRGDFESAKTKALQAYLEGIEPVEPRIRANDPDAVIAIEERMADVRTAIDERKSPEELATAISAADAQIDTVAKLIEQRELSPWLAFAAAFAILLREGFEAVLIILALLGVIRAAGSKEAARWIHGGWLAALAVGLITWFSSGFLMNLSGASRELMEGAISLFAVVVLLYVGFWLHRQSEIGRWKQFLEVKVKGMLHGKNLFGLAVIAFFAVFREAFETVLFLKAIELESGPDARSMLYIGVVSSLALVFTLSWIALKLSRKLPLRTLFTTSSVIMLALATVLTGKGLHAIQETGLVDATSSPLPLRWEFAGVYPTVQTLLAQLLVAAFVLFLWWYGRKPTSAPVVKVSEATRIAK